MQKIQISRSLDAILASATFQATKRGAIDRFEEILFVELISNPNSLSYEFLTDRLDREQVKSLEGQLRRMLATPSTASHLEVISPASYYRDFVDALGRTYPEVQRLSTIHALLYIASDESTLCSQLLSKMGLHLDLLKREISLYGAGDSLSQMLLLDIKRSTREGESAPQQREHPLSNFGVNLTYVARSGGLDPVIGREKEIARVVETLSRRKKNNPVLVGEAGVGKSAIVEGLALRLASGDVPHSIRGKELFSVDLSSLVAGTKFRGEFEERMQQLLKALSESRDTIIFIDEIHTIVGAGSSQGSLDAANILKPALARGEIQAIGATTFSEYRSAIESDAALERRLQKIVVEPTTLEQSVEILMRIAPSYEEHHRVIYSDEALEACVELSSRYINDRSLPDKAIDLMDEAGARAYVGSQGEVQKVERVDIERLITDMTGIPAERLSGDEQGRFQQLAPYLSSRVIGQQSSVERLSRTIRRSRVGLASSDRPRGVFMFVGPTGVGKTLLAKELAEWMFDTRRSLIRIDMSEYGQSHNASRLIGSPPGYVGYGEGGELSEAVRRNPYSVVLLDEIEKAHSDIFNLMLQIFDEGHITDATGRKIDFRNTIIIMTSNVGSRAIASTPTKVGYAAEEPKGDRDKRLYISALEERFAPEFLNRVDDILIFTQLDREHMKQIVTLELESIFTRARELGYNMRVTPSAKSELAQLGYQPKYGARALRRTLIERVEEPLSDLIVEGVVKLGDTIVIERERSQRGVKLKVV